MSQAHGVQERPHLFCNHSDPNAAIQDDMHGRINVAVAGVKELPKT